MTEDPPSRSGEGLYHVVRRAVEDALWHVLGTAVYTLFLLFLFFVGVQFAVAGYGDGNVSAVVTAVGVVLSLVALLEGARTYDLLPF